MSSFFDGEEPAPEFKQQPQSPAKAAPPIQPTEAAVDVLRRVEMSVIEELVFSDDAMSVVIELGLRPEHFFHSDTRTIFEIILGRHGENKKTDLIILAELAAKDPVYKAHGLSGTVLKLGSNGSGGSWMLTTYVNEVMESFLKRDLQSKVSSLAREVSGGNFNVDEVRARIANVAQESHRKQAERKSIKQHVLEAMERARIVMQGGKHPGVPTPFRSMRRYAKTFRDGDSILIAGRPSSGKTSLALSAAAEIAAEYGEGSANKVLILSLESPAAQITDRLIQILGEIDLKNAEFFNQRETVAFGTAMAKLAKLPIVIHDSHGMRIDELCATVERYVREEGVRIVFIDYVERIFSTLRESAPYREKIGQIAVRLSILSKKLGVPIVTLTQLSRECEKENRRPRLSDLGESGALEKEADVVIMIWKPKADLFEKEVVEMNLAFEKNRDGPTGTFVMEMKKFCTKYLDVQTQIPEDAV